MRKLIHFLKALANDERIPMQNRIVLGGLLLYLMTPVDIFPDFIPMIGWLDDAFVFLIIMDYVFNSADTSLILDHYPWSRENFNRVKARVATLSWLVPDRVRKILFRSAEALALREPATKPARTEA